jgi:hypothetical protein
MNKYILSLTLLLMILVFAACSKDSELSVPTTVKLRYEFSAQQSDSFIVSFSIDTLNNGTEYTETISALSWNKDTIIPASGVQRVTRFVAFAPIAWGGTTLQTAAHLRIWVDDVEKSSATGTLSGFDRPTGLSVTARY